MNNLLIRLLTISIFCIPFQANSQEDSAFDVTYEVQRVYKPLALSKENLKKAERLSDLNRFYKSTWVAEYLSIEITTFQNGIQKKANSKDELLTEAQKENLLHADDASDISVSIRYMPNNTLSKNDPKEINFSFIVDPEKQASFPGGQKKLEEYLHVNAASKISDDRYDQYNVAAVQFTINEKGQVVDAYIFDSSMYSKTEDKLRDELLLRTICDMPNWEPAEYSKGLKVKQDFVLTAGDQTSCTVNLFNVRRELPQ